MIKNKLKAYIKRHRRVAISLKDLQVKYNVSRAPLVRALKILENEKKIRIKKGYDKNNKNKTNIYIYIGRV